MAVKDNWDFESCKAKIFNGDKLDFYDKIRTIHTYGGEPEVFRARVAEWVIEKKVDDIVELIALCDHIAIKSELVEMALSFSPNTVFSVCTTLVEDSVILVIDENGTNLRITICSAIVDGDIVTLNKGMATECKITLFKMKKEGI